MTKIFTLEHIGLAARDPGALIAWYQRVLDAELVWEISRSPTAALLNLGGTMIEIYSAQTGQLVLALGTGRNPQFQP